MYIVRLFACQVVFRKIFVDLVDIRIHLVFTLAFAEYDIFIAAEACAYIVLVCGGLKCVCHSENSVVALVVPEVVVYQLQIVKIHRNDHTVSLNSVLGIIVVYSEKASAVVQRGERIGDIEHIDLLCVCVQLVLPAYRF